MCYDPSSELLLEGGSNVGSQEKAVHSYYKIIIKYSVISQPLDCIEYFCCREDTTQTEMLIEEVEDDNPSFVRRPRRLTRSRHVDIRHFLSSFGRL